CSGMIQDSHSCDPDSIPGICRSVINATAMSTSHFQKVQHTSSKVHPYTTWNSWKRVRIIMSSAGYLRGKFLPTIMNDSMFLCQKSDQNHYCCLELFNCCNSPLLDIRFPCNCLESHFPEKVRCTSSVVVSYKIPILVTGVRFPASADL